jgi:hypothetical protein
MSLRLSNHKKAHGGMRGGSRVQDAQQRAATSARKAARQMGPTSRQARKMAASRMMSARDWSAPRIDSAGQYFEREVGPRVNDLLHRTAGMVEPSRPRRRRRGIAAMLLVVGGALGAAGAIATRRNAAQSEDASMASADSLPEASNNSGSEHAHTS